MMKRTFAALVLIFATTSAALAQDEERILQLVNIVRNNDCRLTEADARRILPEHDFTRSEYQSITKTMGERGWLERGDFAVLTLSDEVCNLD